MFTLLWCLLRPPISTIIYSFFSSTCLSLIETRTRQEPTHRAVYTTCGKAKNNHNRQHVYRHNRPGPSPLSLSLSLAKDQSFSILFYINRQIVEDFLFFHSNENGGWKRKKRVLKAWFQHTHFLPVCCWKKKREDVDDIRLPTHTGERVEMRSLTAILNRLLVWTATNSLVTLTLKGLLLKKKTREIYYKM